MESILEKVKNNISVTLPSLPTEVVHRVGMNLIEEVGVTEVEDLSLVQVEDLKEHLKPIHIRKLLNAWKFSGQTNVERLVLNPAEHFLLNTASEESVAMNKNWEEFIIPWQAMPLKLTEALSKGVRPSPSLKRKMIRHVADKMHSVCRLPGRRAINLISTKMVEKYPELFKDTLCGESFESGNFSISKSLENRIEYLNRGLQSHGHKCTQAAMNDRETCNLDSRINEEKNLSKYGCLNWQPISLPENETTLTQEEKRKEMLQLAQVGPKADNVHINKLICDTFYSQREDINKNLPVDELMEKWPLIFGKLGLLEHFKMLVGVDLAEKFSDEFQKKAKRIVECLKSVPPSSNKKSLQNAVLEVKNLDSQTKESDVAILILLVQGYFGEPINTLFKVVDSTATCHDIKKMRDLPSTPCLVVCGTALHASAESFLLIIDSVVVNNDIASFKEGFLMLFASFYVLNICYPQSAGSTLEFIQRCFLNINPTRGSKIDRKKGKKSTIDPKVLTLLNAISDYEWLS